MSRISHGIRSMLGSKTFRYSIVLLCLVALYYILIDPAFLRLMPEGVKDLVHSIPRSLIPPKDLIPNVFNEVLGAIIVSAFIERHFSLFQIKESHRLDIPQFCRSIESARHRVRILDIWMKSILLTQNYREQFKQSIVGALRRGRVKIRIVVVRPDSPAARKRAEELCGTSGFSASADEILKHMRECLGMLRAIKEESLRPAPPTLWTRFLRRNPAEGSPDDFQIDLIDESPELAMYEVDDFAYWSFYPSNGVSSDGHQMHVPSATSIGRFLCAQFEDIGRRAQSMDNWEPEVAAV